MTDSQNEYPDIPQEKENKLKAERCDDFHRVLGALYVFGNRSGRQHFIKDWPEAAASILGAELITFDTEGTEDYERREILEGEADERRLRVLDILDEFEEKSVFEGALRMDYVEKVVKALGREMALLVYAPRIVEKVLGVSSQSVSPVVSTVQKVENYDAVEYTDTKPIYKKAMVRSGSDVAHPEIKPIDVDDTDISE